MSLLCENGRAESRMTSDLEKPAQRASDHLANERTFLAWVRTSISVIVFGFVVAKFGITLRQFFRFENLEPRETGISLALGVSFMVVGILMSILAVWRYQATRVQIEQAAFRPANKTIYIVGGISALLGILLTYYLITTTRTL